jgi:hypothetical protein
MTNADGISSGEIVIVKTSKLCESILILHCVIFSRAVKKSFSVVKIFDLSRQ